MSENGVDRTIVARIKRTYDIASVCSRNGKPLLI